MFVTTNRLLAAAARRFLINEGQLTQAQCPPVLYITQVATIAWLLKDQKLSPDIAGRELLINCYAAARPDAAWFRYFREGLEHVVGDLEDFGRDPQNSLVLQAARRIAQEESLSNSAIMQELNAAEIIDRSREDAAKERSRISESHEAQQRAISEQHETERAEQTLRHTKELKEAQENAAALEQRHKMAQAEQTQRHRRELKEAEEKAAARIRLDITGKLRDTNARRIVWAIQLVLFAVFVSLFFLDAVDIMREHPWVVLALKLTLGLVAGIHFLDLIGIKFVSRRFDRLRMWIARKEERRLAKKLA
jgi:hypothetical protein